MSLVGIVSECTGFVGVDRQLLCRTFHQGNFPALYYYLYYFVIDL